MFDTIIRVTQITKATPALQQIKQLYFCGRDLFDIHFTVQIAYFE